MGRACIRFLFLRAYPRLVLIFCVCIPKIVAGMKNRVDFINWCLYIAPAVLFVFKYFNEMEMLLHSASWFEIPVTDFERAKKFYSTIYDYEMPTMDFGPNKMGFLLYDMEKQGIGGAIVHGEGYVPAMTGSVVYLNGGNDLNTVLNRVAPAGGEVLAPKFSLGDNMGHVAYFKDSEGNKLALHSMN